MNPFKGPRRKAAIALAAGAAVIATAGGAWAFISMNTTGSASAAAAQVNPLTVSDIVVVPMLPGTIRSITFKLTNPNNFPVKVTGIKRSSPAIVGGGGNCAPGQLTGPLSTPDLLEVPGTPTINAGDTNFTVPAALGLADTATAACTASFDLTVTAIQQGN
jgi:hypothetical protein